MHRWSELHFATGGDTLVRGRAQGVEGKGAGSTSVLEFGLRQRTPNLSPDGRAFESENPRFVAQTRLARTIPDEGRLVVAGHNAADGSSLPSDVPIPSAVMRSPWKAFNPVLSMSRMK